MAQKEAYFKNSKIKHTQVSEIFYIVLANPKFFDTKAKKFNHIKILLNIEESENRKTCEKNYLVFPNIDLIISSHTVSPIC
jgi:hypothetical protein